MKRWFLLRVGKLTFICAGPFKLYGGAILSLGESSIGKVWEFRAQDLPVEEFGHVDEVVVMVADVDGFAAYAFDGIAQAFVEFQSLRIVTKYIELNAHESVAAGPDIEFVNKLGAVAKSAIGG